MVRWKTKVFRFHIKYILRWGQKEILLWWSTTKIFKFHKKKKRLGWGQKEILLGFYSKLISISPGKQNFEEVAASVSKKQIPWFWAKMSKWVHIHLIIFLVIFSNPTVPSSIIKSLPGFSGSLPFKLETGWVFQIWCKSLRESLIAKSLKIFQYITSCLVGW